MLDVIGLSILLSWVACRLLTSNPSTRYRYGSFAPVRKSDRAMWYVDGQDYMSAVADAIGTAKTEILITDWQMNPEIFMKRPDSGVDSHSLHWRLDKMLLKKADEGVKVTILLYKEMEFALDLGSAHVVKLFADHKNIEVYRHPDTVNGLQNLFRWSHHEKMVIVDRSIAFVGGIDLCYGRWDTRNHELKDYPIHPGVTGNNALGDNPNYQGRYARWAGKDYRNTFYNKEAKTKWDEPLEDYDGVDRNEIPRMPWHDVSCAFTGEVVQDAVRHFTDRYNAIAKPWWWRRFWESLCQYFYYNTNQATQPVLSQNIEAEGIKLNSDGFPVNIQLLRSVDDWSADQPHEESIHKAYVNAIKNAKHFIYIENQFFISSQNGFWFPIKNEIQEALVGRIVRAHETNENFHVMVIIPLKPEFPGDWDAKNWNAKVLRSVAFWNQATVFRGEDSLFSKLEKENIPNEVAEKYFSVYSLRKYELIGKHFVTEIVYVHSKIMIVDDRLAIIGSANINDRSMLGHRDSEIAVLIEDFDLVDGKMNGAEYKMGKFAHSLRCDLLKEHLGIVGDNEDGMKINDPLDNSFINGVVKLAKTNTVCYRTVFGEGLLPRDSVNDFDLLKVCKNISVRQEDTIRARQILAKIKGNIVNHPKNFLSKELKPNIFLDSMLAINQGPRADTCARKEEEDEDEHSEIEDGQASGESKDVITIDPKACECKMFVVMALEQPHRRSEFELEPRVFPLVSSNVIVGTAFILKDRNSKSHVVSWSSKPQPTCITIVKRGDSKHVHTISLRKVGNSNLLTGNVPEEMCNSVPEFEAATPNMTGKEIQLFMTSRRAACGFCDGLVMAKLSKICPLEKLSDDTYVRKRGGQFKSFPVGAPVVHDVNMVVGIVTGTGSKKNKVTVLGIQDVISELDG